MREDSEYNIIEHGKDCMTRVYQGGYPRKTRDANGKWTLEERFFIHEDALDGEIPAVYARNENLPINSVEITSGIAGYPHLRDVLLVWREDDGNWNGATNDSSISIRSQGQFTERDIEDHPLWKELGNGGTELTEDQEMLKYYRPKFGVTSILFIITESKKKSSYKWEQETLIGEMHQIKSPPYLKNANPKCWKCIGREISWTKGGYVEITDTWQYDLYQWEGTVSPLMSREDMDKLLAKLRPLWNSKKGK